MIKDPTYYETLDKRTKEYKDYVKDLKDYKEFEEIAEVSTNGKKEPRKILRPLTKEQHKQYKAYKQKRTLDVWNTKDITFLVNLYAHIFALQHDKTELTKESKGAFKKLSNISKELDVVFDGYKTK